MNRLAILIVGFLAAGACPAAAPPPLLHSGRLLEAWVTDLVDPDLLVREEALEVLAHAGDAARVALPHLTPLLRHESRPLRTRTGLAIWRIGGDSAPALRILSETLEDADPVVRRQALDALAQLQGEASSTVPLIIAFLESDDPTLRGKASQTLSRMGRPGVVGLLRALEDRNPRMRRCAASQLADTALVYFARADLPRLRARLADADLPVRVEAARILWSMAEFDPRVLTVLAEGIRGKDPVRRTSILGTLASSSFRPPTLLPVLEAALKIPDRGVQVQAASLLHAIEKQPARVVPLYVEILKENNRSHWQQALQGLAEAGVEAKVALPRLIEILKLRDYYSWNLRTTLVRIGPASIPSMIEMLEDAAVQPDGYYSDPRETAIVILSELGPLAVRAVTPLLASKDPAVRVRALRVLGRMGTEAKDAMPRVLDLLADPDNTLREHAVNTLGAMGEAARPACPRLLQLARIPITSLRIACSNALAQIGPDPALAVPLALGALEDREVQVQIAGLALLARVDPGNRQFIPQARRLLRNSSVTLNVLSTLGEMKGDAAWAVPDIVTLLDSSNVALRRAAIETLGAMGSRAGNAVPALLAVLHQSDRMILPHVFSALRQIQPEPATILPALTTFAVSRPGVSDNPAVSMLGEFGEKAASAFPALVTIVRDPRQSATTRANALLALAQVDLARARKEALADGRRLLQADATNTTLIRTMLMLDPGDREAVELAEASLRSPSHWNRALACVQLGQLSAAGKRFLPLIQALTRDVHPTVRCSAAVALWRLTRETRETIPLLLGVLRQPGEAYIRGQAAMNLAELGPDAGSALPALEKILADPDPYVRNQVRLAMKKIQATRR